MMSIIDSFFWQKLILLIFSVAVLILGFEFFMGKLFKVKRRKFFSYNHINEQHKKIDWIIRVSFTVAILILYIYRIINEFMEVPFYLEFWFLLFIFIIATEGLRAYMEWKHLENKKIFLFTVSNLTFVLIILVLTFTTEFFGLFA